MTDPVERIHLLLDACTEEQRRAIFNRLRQEFPIHALEEKLNTQAEIILEAINRAPDITQRGVRGIIAESVFVTDVVGPLIQRGWRDETIEGEYPYDVLLDDGHGRVRVQVKMQRLSKGAPTTRKDYPGLYVVETQRTRTGKRRTPGEGTGGETDENTRPYRVGDFDILAVSMHPSTRSWSDFRYTVAAWLLPRPDDARLLRVFQPVAPHPNDDWTDDFLEAIGWLRSHQRKTIRSRADPLP